MKLIQLPFHKILVIFLVVVFFVCAVKLFTENKVNTSNICKNLVFEFINSIYILIR